MSRKKSFVKKDSVEFELMYEDIVEDTRESMMLGEYYELYWTDFTEEFRKRYINFYGNNGNYDIIPLTVCLDQNMVDGITPVFQWVEVSEEDYR